MGPAQQDNQGDAIITHGICATCTSKFFGDLGLDLNTLLDSMGVPVVVVDAAASVKAANRQARAFIRKDFPSVENYLIGDVFECLHAKQPGGCGHTVHCSGCTIRNTVTDTFHTGKSHLKVPSILNRDTPDDCGKVDLLISTEKVAGVVVLRIDEVGGSGSSGH